jgi:3-oxoacyl-[acyl-carrier protein] reductase
MNTDHSERIALITGGGRGFGKAFGHALANRGATVILADIDVEAAHSAAQEIIATGGSAKGISCDVADEAQVRSMMVSVAKEFGGIDMLINNAGLHSEAYNKSMEEMGIEKVKRLFDVNVMGTINCSLIAKPYMSNRAGAAIINISSSAAYSSGTSYGASKLAVQGITMTMAREFAGDGIRVNGIAPGLIFTETIRNELSEDSVNRVMGMQILPQEGDEDDIVEAMLFLTSNKAKFITGETMRVSGGFALGI